MKQSDLKKYAVLALAIVLLLFVVQNARVVEVNFLFWSFQMSRIFLILIVFAIGFLVGNLAAGFKRRTPKA